MPRDSGFDFESLLPLLSFGSGLAGHDLTPALLSIANARQRQSQNEALQGYRQDQYQRALQEAQFKQQTELLGRQAKAKAAQSLGLPSEIQDIAGTLPDSVFNALAKPYLEQSLVPPVDPQTLMAGGELTPYGQQLAQATGGVDIINLNQGPPAITEPELTYRGQYPITQSPAWDPDNLGQMPVGTQLPSETGEIREITKAAQLVPPQMIPGVALTEEAQRFANLPPEQQLKQMLLRHVPLTHGQRQVIGAEVAYQSDLGKAIGDYELQRERGTPDDDPRMVTLLAQINRQGRKPLTDEQFRGYVNDHERKAKQFLSSKEAYNQFASVMDQPDLGGIGDQMLIIMYNKIFQPESTVLQGEAEATAYAQGMLAHFKTLGQRFHDGTSLTEQGRAAMISAAKAAYRARVLNQLDRNEVFDAILKNRHLDADTRQAIINSVPLSPDELALAEEQPASRLAKPPREEIQAAHALATAPIVLPDGTPGPPRPLNQDLFDQYLIIRGYDPRKLQ